MLLPFYFKYDAIVLIKPHSSTMTFFRESVFFANVVFVKESVGFIQCIYACEGRVKV
jgi:hypothetical protein